MLGNVTEVADKAINQIDKAILSDQEREQMLTERQRIDMTSPFKLPQLIRPILAIWGAATYTIAQIYCLALDLISGQDVMIANGGIVLTIIGFYFNSRKAEKINAKKVEAAIKIEEAKNKLTVEREKMEIKEDKKQSRQDRRQARREARNNE